MKSVISRLRCNMPTGEQKDRAENMQRYVFLGGGYCRRTVSPPSADHRQPADQYTNLRDCLVDNLRILKWCDVLHRTKQVAVWTNIHVHARGIAKIVLCLGHVFHRSVNEHRDILVMARLHGQMSLPRLTDP